MAASLRDRFADPLRHRTPSERIIALTFDDGPNEPYTSELLDVLGRSGVKATFFLVGSNAERFPEVVRRIVRDGHAIGNHSYSHRFSRFFSDPSFRGEIERAQRAIADITGFRPTLFRSPWLVAHPFLRRTLRRHGLREVRGTFASALEIFQPNAERLAAAALRRARPGRVLIFHDGYNARGGDRSATVRAVAILIRELRDRGYRFVMIPELFEQEAMTT